MAESSASYRLASTGEIPLYGPDLFTTGFNALILNRSVYFNDMSFDFTLMAGSFRLENRDQIHGGLTLPEAIYLYYSTTS